MLLLKRAACVAALSLAASCGDAEITMVASSDVNSARGDGKTAIVLTARVNRGDTALNRGTVTFSSDLDGSSFEEILDTTTRPDSDSRTETVDVLSGKATAKLYSMLKGTALVTVTFRDDLTEKVISDTLSLTFTGAAVSIASFDYIGANPSQVALGGNTTVSFKAKDSQGQPVPNLSVSFSVSPAGVGTIDPVSGVTALDGTVSTTLTAGQIAGTAIVQASAEGVTRSSDAIAISGGNVNAKALSLVCPHYSIGGFEKFGLKMNCTVYAADYNGAFVPNSEVVFKTEAGGVPQSVKLESGSQGGFATFEYRTECPLPRDVPPLSGEWNAPGTFKELCGTGVGNTVSRTFNPRDGRATLIAYTTGSEAFTDNNGNGKWDSGESYIDLPEPFVDADDDGKRGTDEDFYDANQNGKWDDKNGKYDNNTAVWTNVKVTWTDEPIEALVTPGNNHAPSHCSTVIYSVTLKDFNGNPPTATGSSDGIAATCSGNCDVDKVTAYDDEDGKAQVYISDGHSCPDPCEAPDCVPEGYTVSMSIERTLDTETEESVIEELDGIMKSSAGPRSGT